MTSRTINESGVDEFPDKRSIDDILAEFDEALIVDIASGKEGPDGGIPTDPTALPAGQPATG